MDQHHGSAVAPDDTRDERLYSTTQVARKLGVSSRTVRRWIKARAITVVHCGTLLRVRQADLADFCEVVERLPRTPPAPAGQERSRTG